MAPWNLEKTRDEQSSPHWQIPVFGKSRDPTRDGINTGIQPLMSLPYLAEQNKNRGCESTNILRVHRPRWKIIYIYICLYVIDIHKYVHVK